MKFKDRKIGKFLTSPIVKGALFSIPGVGPLAKNILNESMDTDPGTVDKKEVITDTIQLIIVGVIVILFLTGKISMEQAEQAQQIIESVD